MRRRSANAPALDSVLDHLAAWCEAEGYRGFDPYDALSGTLLGTFGVFGRTGRLALTQAVKILPVNPRRWLGIRKAENPKGISLLLRATVAQWERARLRGADADAAAAAATADAGRAAVVDESTSHLASSDLASLHDVVAHGETTPLRARADFLFDRLRALAAPGVPGRAWGYPFPWQSRYFFADAGTPNVVATSFAAEALLDAGIALGRVEEGLYEASAAAEFFLEALHPRETEDGGLVFSYTPNDRTEIFNASLLAARILARVGAAKGDANLVETAARVGRWVLGAQRLDGSWAYGAGAHQDWVDGTHTGFVLEALATLEDAGCGLDAREALRRGAEFYRARCFGPQGDGRVHAERPFPMEPHHAAQGIVTFLRLGEAIAPGGAAFARRIAERTVELALLADGSFLCRRGPFVVNRIRYLRWTQAWMMRALAELLLAEDRSRAGLDRAPLATLPAASMRPADSPGAAARVSADRPPPPPRRGDPASTASLVGARVSLAGSG